MQKFKVYFWKHLPKQLFKDIKPQYKDRLKVCQGDVGIPQCEHYDNGRCKHVDCGCFLSKNGQSAE